MPSKFTTVKQPKGSLICTAAVAAMAVGKDLAYAERYMCPSVNEESQKPYYKTVELLKFLGTHSIYTGPIAINESSSSDLATLLSGDTLNIERPMKWPAIITVISETRPSEYTHYVFWDGTVVRDPNPGVPDERPLLDYCVIDIMCLTYLEKTDEH